jgi:nucleoside-diphosphate-sugar epimerase
MPTTLILGGSGFVSGAMAAFGLARGHAVYTLTRGVRLPAAGVNPILADRNDPAAVAAAFRDAPRFFDAVVDCIGFTAAHAEQDLALFFPPDAPPRAGHLVFLSSDFVPSAVDRPFFIDETYDRFDSFPYAAGKRAAEVTLLSAAAGRGLPITVLRPCHIYGPGSLLGCLPLHGRDPQLVARLRRQEPLRLLGGGHFLQHPIYVDDLCALAFACARTPRTRGQLYFAAGPDVIESRRFYQLIAECLRLPITIEEAPITPYLREHPDHLPFCCHRLYRLDKLIGHGLPVPATDVRTGLTRHLASYDPH